MIKLAHRLVCEICGKIVMGTENIKQKGYKCVQCKIAEMSYMDESEFEDWSKELKRRNKEWNLFEV